MRYLENSHEEIFIDIYGHINAPDPKKRKINFYLSKFYNFVQNTSKIVLKN